MPQTGMARSSPVLVLILTTALLQAATLHRLAGPWQVWQEGGGLHVAVELGLPPTASEMAMLTLWHQVDAQASLKPVAALPELGPVQRPLRQPSWLLRWNLLPEQVLAGQYQVYYGHRLDGHEPLLSWWTRNRPASADPVQVVLVSPCNYPFAGELAALEQAYGAVDLIVVLGAGVSSRLGQGGWESRLPLVALSPAAVDLTAWVGSEHMWREGLRVGILGLPAQRDARIANAVISRDDSPWQVFLDPEGIWDHSLVAESGRLGDLALLLAAGMRRRLPLICSAGRAVGHVSEPLGIAVDYDQRLGQLAIMQRLLSVSDVAVARRHAQQASKPLDEVLLLDGRLTRNQLTTLTTKLDRILADEVQASDKTIIIRPGGTRHVVVGAAGGAFRSVPAEVAYPLHERALILLQVELEHLRCRLVQSDGSDLLPPLVYEPIRDGQEAGGSGRAGDHAAAMNWLTQAEGADDFSDEVRNHLIWAVRQRFQEVATTPDALHRLLDRSLAETAALPLLRRLTALDSVVVGAWLQRHLDVASRVMHDWLLRQLADPSADLQGQDAAAVIRNCQDPSTLRSVLAYLDRCSEQRRLALLQHLVLRLQDQVQGALPPDADPWIQHGMMVAIFDSPYLSADALQELCVAVVPQVRGLARKPVLRFIGTRTSVRFAEQLAFDASQPALIAAIADAVAAYPDTASSGGLRLGIRRQLKSQVLKQTPWLPDPQQRQLIQLALSDQQWQGPERQGVLKLLRRSKRDLLPDALRDQSP